MSHRSLSLMFQIGMALCFFVFLTSAHAGDGKPAVLIEADTHDFGEAFEGTDVTHDFIVKNTGDADLQIQSVKAG